MLLKFDPKGNSKQFEVCALWMDKVHTDIVYGGSKGSGKSFLGVSLIFGDAFTYPNTHYFIARDTLKNLKVNTIPSIYEVFGIWGITQDYYKFNSMDSYFQLYNGSRVYLIECSYRPTDPLYARFGGMQITRGWIEEAGEVCRDAKNNLAASIGRWQNDKYGLTPKLLQTCNPSNNYLFTDYYKPFVNGDLPEWAAFVQALPTDNKMLPKDYLPNLQKVLTNNQKQRLLYGRWEFDDNPDLLVSYDAVCDVFTNTPTALGGKRISADIALKGRDRFVVAKWDGTRATIANDTNYIDARGVESFISNLAAREGVGRSQIVADSDGLGGFLGSYLDGIVEFHNGAKAYDTKFTNIKSQCAYKLAELINTRTLKIDCSEEQREHIKEELMVLIAKPLENKLGLISKDDMKSLIGHSPDYLDALIYGCYHLIAPARKGMHNNLIVKNF